MRNGVLNRITTDHSYVQELVNEGVITAEDARKHPQKNIVTRALGIDRYVAVDVFSHDVQPGDRFLLCSDGLVDEVADADIAHILTSHSSPVDASTALVNAANDAGGRDNTTVIVVDVVTDSAETVTSEPLSTLSITTTTATVQVSTTPETTSQSSKKRILIGALVAAFVVVSIFTVSTIVGVYARSGYFIGTNDDNVITIYRGRAGGVWWFHPTVAVESELKLTDVATDIVREVRDNKEFQSLADAQQYIEILTAAITATTTTTLPTTDTTIPGSTSTIG